MGVIKGRKGVLGVGRAGRDEKQSGVAPGNHQRDGGNPRFRKRLARGAVHFILQQHGVDVAFQVIDAHQGLVQGESAKALP